MVRGGEILNFQYKGNSLKLLLFESAEESSLVLIKNN
jgi:hypothetical protein